MTFTKTLFAALAIAVPASFTIARAEGDADKKEDKGDKKGKKHDKKEDKGDKKEEKKAK